MLKATKHKPPLTHSDVKMVAHSMSDIKRLFEGTKEEEASDKKLKTRED